MILRNIFVQLFPISVDYSAHICYHYMSVEEKSPDQKIAASLFALGLPIIQGAMSTVLGVGSI